MNGYGKEMARFNRIGQGKAERNETAGGRMGKSGQQQYCMEENGTR